MTFKVIQNQLSHSAQRKSVSIGAVRNGKYTTTRIRFGSDILDAMGWLPGCRLSLAFGEDVHKGKLRIKLDDLNGYKLQRGAPRDKGKYLQCARIGDGKKHIRRAASHEIIGNYLFVDLPNWLQPLDEGYLI